MRRRKKRNHLLPVILCAILLLILVIAAGVCYVYVTKETDTLQREINDLKDSNAFIQEKIEESQQDVEEKTSQLEAVKEPEPTPTPEPIKGKVAIDPGHQGSWVDMSATEPNAPGSDTMKTKASTGTQGTYTGIYEYELNLDISLMLAEELKARGYEVVLTREDNNTAISNAERAVLANESGADFLIRIHANGSEDPGVSGALALVPGPDNPYVGDLSAKSTELAQDVLNSYCEATSLSNQDVINDNTMTGINWSQIPVMILEMGFMTNESDDTKMADTSFRSQMVAGIANGIDLYYSQNPTKAAGSADSASQAETSSEIQEILAAVDSQYLQEPKAAGETWAVSLCDLKNQRAGSLNGDVQMRSASLMKLFIMAAVYDRVCYPASAEASVYFQESYEGELKELLTKMITMSDNESANLIVERLGGGDFSAGMNVVNQFCSEHGYNSTSMGRRFLADSAENDNYTSANDCAALLSSIYQGTCVNEEASAKMMEYLKNQKKLEKIPAGLSEYQVITANKTGELSSPEFGYVENDAAIVWGQNLDYVLCILSGDLVNGNQTAADRICSISKMIYEEIGA